MVTKTSLREWAKENKLWEPKTWRTFLEKYLVPFYKQVYTLNVLYEFLKSEKVCGKPSLADIEDETLKNKIRVAIYGGVEPNKDFSTSFAKFMYDNLGICAENAPSFEESIKHYESWGDGIKISVNTNSWVNSIPIGTLLDKLRDLISWKLCRELGIKLTEIGIQESYPNAPLEVVDPDTLLPQPGEKPEKLIELINNYRQKALDLSIGVNPFMTFVFYSRTIPLPTLMEFLECDMDKITKLANFLGLKAYSMIDQREVSLPTKSPDKVVLLQTKNSLSYKLLGLQRFLERIDLLIKETYESIIKQAVDQIHITFEPWEEYEAIFRFLDEALEDKKSYVECHVENGKITALRTFTRDCYKGYPIYKNISLEKAIPLSSFWKIISPAICAGILVFDGDCFNLYSLTKKWVDKVIKNEGKT